jgi:hypothetical protein
VSVVLLNANMPSGVVSNVMSRGMFSSLKRSSLLFQSVNYNQNRFIKMVIAVRKFLTKLNYYLVKFCTLYAINKAMHILLKYDIYVRGKPVSMFSFS